MTKHRLVRALIWVVGGGAVTGALLVLAAFWLMGDGSAAGGCGGG